MVEGRLYDPKAGRYLNIAIGAEAAGSQNAYLFAGNSPASGSAMGGTENGRSSRVVDNGPGFAALWVHYLNPENHESALSKGVMYVAYGALVVSAGTLAAITAPVWAPAVGSFATSMGTMAGAAWTSTTTAMAAWGTVNAIGAGVGAINGAMSTYAADHNASVLDIVGGALMGGIGGAFNPYGAFIGAAASIIGGAIEVGMGGEFLGKGFQWGEIAGNIAGSGASAFKNPKGIFSATQRACAGTKMLVHAAPVVYGAILGYEINGSEGVLQGAKYGDMVGSMAAAFTKACFAAGTPLMETETASKPIEEFRSFEEFGDECDLILARDENNPDAPLERRRVLRKFVRSALVLRLKAGGQTIETTDEHPFYELDRGWTKAQELKPGDVLVSHTGEQIVVTEIASTGRIATVYNLEVEGCHTYFVGDAGWGFSVWAHNAACSPSQQLAQDEDQARRSLRRSMKGISPIDEAHHAVPYELRDHDLVQYAASRGWAMNRGASNGVALGGPKAAIVQHNGSHWIYNSKVENKLDRIIARHGGLNDGSYNEFLDYVAKMQKALPRLTSRLS